MTKKELIEDILSRNIHHNIYIDHQKLPKFNKTDDEDMIDTSDIGGYMVGGFKEQFEDYQENPLNDTGNRNVGDDCEIKGEIYSGGRMGATLYWDAYYSEYGRFNRYDENDLEQMTLPEVKTIQKDLDEFDKRINILMTSFYKECQFKLDEAREIKKQEVIDEKQHQKDEKKYQQIKKQVAENNYLKRLLNDLIN